ncbi:MAG: U32 family peptidase, partial [Desulfobacteraceae bacterium]|nr:U32 family peptidase [Desulfobacteraceae bacterium]
LKVSVKTPDTSFIVSSETNLINSDKYTINYDCLFKTLKVLNNTEYYIKHLKLDNLQKDLFIPFKELAGIKKRIFSILNDSKELTGPIDIPFKKKQSILKIKPTLAVLISSEKDLYLCNKTSADIFFQLPNCFKNENFKLVNLFLKNKKLIPWFPSVLIGENYTAAKDFLSQVRPNLIVTNNTGIAYEAYKKGIRWIAGPYLNITNSFGLSCLKENFDCHGSFISNELNKYQIKNITNPENLKLYYSIYHPILLMTSRQCLLRQVVGCEKDRIDGECIHECNKSSSITNLKKVPLFIEKTKGGYHCIYNSNNFLNTDIVNDLPDIFSSFFIDLRDIKTETEIEVDKSGIIKLFGNFLNGNPDSKKQLGQIIHPSTSAQYKKGI